MSRTLIAMASLALLAFTACKKEYTCTCSFSYVVDGQTVNESALYVDEYRTKSNAIQYCTEREDSYLNSGATSADCVSQVN